MLIAHIQDQVAETMIASAYKDKNTLFHIPKNLKVGCRFGAAALP
jgi:hypothetical protein